MSPPFFLSLLTFTLGTVFGSFGNVLIVRLPEAKSIGGRSRCPHCERTLRLFDLIPIVSFVVLRGRCRHCKKRISFQYPLVELASGFLFVLALYREFPSVFLSQSLALALWLLLLIAVTDFQTGMIPDAFSVPFLVLASLVGVHTAPAAWIPAAVACGFFGLQWLMSRGSWVGSGDILLATGIGFFLGTLSRLFVALATAYVAGALVAIILLFFNRKRLKETIVFAPFLAAGTVFSLLCGDRIVAFLLGT